MITGLAGKGNNMAQTCFRERLMRMASAMATMPVKSDPFLKVIPRAASAEGFVKRISISCEPRRILNEPSSESLWAPTASVELTTFSFRNSSWSPGINPAASAGEPELTASTMTTDSSKPTSALPDKSICATDPSTLSGKQCK